MKKFAAFIIGLIICGYAAVFLFGEYERKNVGTTLGRSFETAEAGSVIIECSATSPSCDALRSDLSTLSLSSEIQAMLNEAEQDDTRLLRHKTLSQTSIEKLGKIKWCLGFDTTPDIMHVVIIINGKVAFSPMIGTNILELRSLLGLLSTDIFLPVEFEI